MELNPSIFLFYYYLQLWRNARERERREAELAAEAAEVSGVFALGATESGSAAEDVRWLNSARTRVTASKSRSSRS
jgi:hypothetical protein